MVASLETTTRNPALAPAYAHHRYITSVDALPVTKENLGINMASHSHAHIQVVPSGGCNPSVAILWWSKAAARFIPEHTPITKAGQGVDTPYEFTVECRGRIMLVIATALASGIAEVHVAGHNVERV